MINLCIDFVCKNKINKFSYKVGVFYEIRSVSALLIIISSCYSYKIEICFYQAIANMINLQCLLTYNKFFMKCKEWFKIFFTDLLISKYFGCLSLSWSHFYWPKCFPDNKFHWPRGSNGRLHFQPSCKGCHTRPSLQWLQHTRSGTTALQEHWIVALKRPWLLNRWKKWKVYNTLAIVSQF